MYVMWLQIITITTSLRYAAVYFSLYDVIICLVSQYKNHEIIRNIFNNINVWCHKTKTMKYFRNGFIYFPEFCRCCVPTRLLYIFIIYKYIYKYICVPSTLLSYIFLQLLWLTITILYYNNTILCTH